MNILLIDINTNIGNKKLYSLKFEKKYNKTHIKYISIDKKVLDKVLNYCYNNYKNKLQNINKSNLFLNKIFKMCYNLKERKLLKYLSKFNSMYDNDNVAILSKNILANKLYYKYVNDIFVKSNIPIFIQENTIIRNDIKNIDEYILRKSIDIQKFKILWIIKSSMNFDYDRLINYLSRYKFIDILNFEKNDINLEKKIEFINKEYGTSIQLINTKNIFEYDVYINFDIKEIDLFNKYIINRDNLYIDMKNSENDIFNQYNILYKKFKDISLEFENFNIKNYTNIDMGYIYSIINTIDK